MERFAGIPERIFDPETSNLVIDCVSTDRYQWTKVTTLGDDSDALAMTTLL